MNKRIFVVSAIAVVRLTVIAAAFTFPAVSGAQTFGAMQIVQGVRVASVFHGAIGPTFVTFTPASLPGCAYNAGGYLTTLWPPAMGGPIDTHKHATQIALLLSAKATGSTLEVRYRMNTNGTGWDNCAIDAIWVTS